MNDTDLRKALVELSKKHPELREKLASEFQWREASTEKEAGSQENYMLVRSLMKIAERGPQIMELIGADVDELEDWQEFKIHMAAEYLDAVFDSLYFREEWLKKVVD